ncbi:hypothetical protein B0H12DRAFT_1238409 [Mycena haematopus]|nr:hypothetical protein B0H12DRAFT_1238409 [Mycena haematopus]
MYGPAGTPTLPAHPAFPHGVPDAGSATTSDSDHGGSTSKSASASVSGCSCLVTGGACHCCTPRIRPGARRRSEPPPPTSLSALITSSPSPTLPIPSPSTGNINASTSPVLPATPHTTPNLSPNPNPNNTNATAIMSTPALPPRAPSHHILARLAELRPVLPRLSARDAALMQGAAGQHDLFHHSPGHGHHPHHPHCGHGEHFSPYGRAYEHATSSYVEYSSDASTSSAGFYQQDARSVESLLSISSLASVTSASHGHGHGHRNQKSHSQKSPSYDGGNTNAFFSGAGVDWRLPPSLSRSSPGGAYPTSPTSYDPNANGSAALAPRPRSEGGGDVYSLGNTSSDASANASNNAVFAPRPRSEAAAAPSNSQLAGYPRPRSEGGGFLGGGVRTCGCGAGCACAGCALHGVSLSSSSRTSVSNGGVPASRSHSKNRSGRNTNGARHCADPAQCGGACLDCTILTLSDFSPGFGGDSKPYRAKLDLGELDGNAGYRSNSNSKAYRPELDLDLGDVDAGYARDLGEFYDLPQEGYDPLDRLELGLELGADIDMDIKMDMDGMGGDAGGDVGDVLDALEQQRQSAAIDEWIREVGALPLPAPGATPFEFEHAFELEGFDGGANPNPNPSAAGSAKPGGGAVKMEFDGMEFDVGQSSLWNFDGAGDVRMLAPTQGLSGADVRAAAEFLSVPGPVSHAHGRSRSSSSASSSEVSMLGVVGVGAGPSTHILGAHGVGVDAGLGAVPALDPHPLARKAPSAMIDEFPAPAYMDMDEQILFFPPLAHAPPPSLGAHPLPHTQ